MSAREEMADLVVKNIELQERIEALEAALESIAEESNLMSDELQEIARAALAPEPDK